MTVPSSIAAVQAFHDDTRSFFRGQRVLVTGGGGFIGSHVVEKLVELGAHPVVPSRAGASAFLAPLGDAVEVVRADLCDRARTVELMTGVDAVMHLAADIGGLSYNMGHSASIFDANMAMGMNVLHGAAAAGATRVLVCSSACIYPRHCSIPTPESEGFVGAPEPTNAGYGWSKRMMEFLAAAYAAESGLSVAIARPYNAYGPRDQFDPERSHVIAALILKALEADGGDFEVWGDGSASRSFIYVEDVARGLIETAARYAAAEAVNVGAEEETSIADLARLIAALVGEVTGRAPTPVFRPEAPAGQPRRKCDTAKARRVLGFEARVPLRDGLRRTIEWRLAR